MGWIVSASGNAEDPNVIRKLLGELGDVLRRPEHETGSSEFSSPHAAAQNFHAPDSQETAAPQATPAPDEHGPDWTPGQGSAPAES